MAEVFHYRVLFYGGAEGYDDTRAEVFLYGEDSRERLGSIKFHDPEMQLPNDRQSGEEITMHLRSERLKNVIDILRNESPIYFVFVDAFRIARLSTSEEPVGEAE